MINFEKLSWFDFKIHERWVTIVERDVVSQQNNLPLNTSNLKFEPQIDWFHHSEPKQLIVMLNFDML
jgi:hypothetical protein